MDREKVNKVLKIIASIIVIGTLFYLVRQNIANTDEITKITNSAGVFGPLMLILLIMIGILFSPIPSVLIIAVAGYIYGPWKGALYSYIGHVIAATSTYFIVKKFKILHESKKFAKYRTFIEKNKNFLFVLYAIPIIPISISSIIAATAIKWKKFMEIALLSFLPAVIVFSFLGGKISSKNMHIIIGLILVITIGTIIIIKKYKSNLEDKVEKNLKKNIRKVKKKK